MTDAGEVTEERTVKVIQTTPIRPRQRSLLLLSQWDCWRVDGTVEIKTVDDITLKKHVCSQKLCPFLTFSHVCGPTFSQRPQGRMRRSRPRTGGVTELCSSTHTLVVWETSGSGRVGASYFLLLSVNVHRGRPLLPRAGRHRTAERERTQTFML